MKVNLGFRLFYITKEKLLLTLPFFIITIYSSNTYGSCSLDGTYWAYVYTLPTQITSSSDVALPKAISSWVYETATASNRPNVVCDIVDNFYEKFLIDGGPTYVNSNLDGGVILATSVYGIGIQIQPAIFRSPGEYMPMNQGYWESTYVISLDRRSSQTNRVGPNFRYRVVQYASINQSSVNFSLSYKGYTGHQSSYVSAYRVSFQGQIHVNNGTCNINNETINLGKINIEKIQSIGNSDWIDSSIKLINCSAFYGGVDIKNYAEIVLEPSNGIYSHPEGIFNLNQSSTSTGVAIQLSEDKNSLFDFAKTPHIRFTLSKSTSSNITIPLFSRMKKIGEVNPGTVNASMTVLVNYK
ncbi:fimbrial protein [Shewanella indica]|uniref:fimbrial protein n=1 Tax=Shewanella indica TaxID=768528 RepID=UPI00399C105A